MAITVKRADERTFDNWNDRLNGSGGSTFYHQSEVLRIFEKYISSELYPLVGYKGQEPVGLLPVFEISKGPITTVFSPPPRLGIPNLGPVLLAPSQIKQRKYEKRNRRFINTSIEWIEEHISPNHIYIQSSPRYDDPRPFEWSNFTISPRFTYYIDVSKNAERIIELFSRDARSNIQNTDPEQYEIRKGDVDDVKFVMGMISDRYETQGKNFKLSTEYAVELFRKFDDAEFPVYVGYVDGERVSGILNPRYGSTVNFWQGGGKPDVPLPINDLIHWQIIEDAVEEEYKYYDLTGANTPRICEYKSKFNPNLKTYYTAERGGTLTSTISEIYKRLQ